jgi:phage-related protein (TIGR01555 family)
MADITSSRPYMSLPPGAADKVAPLSVPSRMARADALMSEMRIPEYPPNVGPSRNDTVRMAQDADINSIIGYAQQAWPGMGFLGFPFLAELSQISEYRQISSRLAQEMTRKWVHFRSRSEEDKSEEIKDIQAEFERLEIQKAFREMAEYDGLFGRGQLYIDLGPADDEELGTPLLPDAHKVGRGSLKCLQPIEPLYSYAYDYDATEPLDRHFYKPRTWYVMKRKVHHSRLLTFISRPLPTMLKPMYAFSGMSMSQLAMPTIENFLKMRQSVANIVQNYSLRGIQTNLSGLLEGGTAQLDSIIQRIQIYTQQSSNEGLMVLDKESENFFQHTTPMTNVDKLLDQARDNMCAVANIPRMVLFGVSPEGMNASADGELAVFEQYVVGMQETLFRHNLEKVLRLVQLSLFGKVDPDITFDFCPLRELDAKQLSEIRNQNAQSDNIYATLGAVASDELRKKLADDPTSGWDNLDLKREVTPVSNKGANPTGSQENTTQGDE